VRDGLKPVHRRLLYAMSQLRLDPDTPPKKSARVVGDVIGRYHPHGDTSVYDALVRLAQDFAVRYRLIDGQGNFGNIDGDNAAAMRYTEARLTEVARALLEGIDEDTVDFRATYDGDGEEPIVLPAAFPNLLANGATGIAVGMATSIPPHNVDELCDALTHLISHPEASIEDLVRFVPGPDFPTGGLLVEPRASVLEAYRTGRGSFRLRARWSVEKLAQGTWQIVVSEIPYQVQKSRLIEKIAELLAQRKLMLLDDVRDESAEDIRLILVPKSRNVDPDVLMESLFKTTDLEVRIGLNMNVLDRNNVPQVMNLQQVLRAFLDHRLEVLERRTRHRLGKIEHRLHVLDGYLIAFLNLDEVIRIIREEDEPKQELMRVFGLTDIQAEAILNMRLRSLRKLEEFELRREHADLSAERADLLGLLADEGRRWKNIAAQIAETRKKFGKTTPLGRRRTDIADAPSAAVIPLDAMVEREPVTVLCSEKGWVRAMRGHLADTGEVKYKEGDRERFVLHAETTDKLVIFGTNGRFYTVAVDKLPRGRGFGEPLRLMIDLPNDAEVVTLFRHQPGRRLLVAASNGRGFQVEEDEVIAQTRAGKQIMAMGDDAEAKLCIPVDGDSVAVVGNNRKLLVFGLDEVPVMARGQGVRLHKYTDGSLNDLKTFRMAEGLSWKIGERTRTETDMTPWKGNRAGIGRLPPNGFPKNNRFG
jgi:topoisomerase-4 subunit A